MAQGGVLVVVGVVVSLVLFLAQGGGWFAVVVLLLFLTQGGVLMNLFMIYLLIDYIFLIYYLYVWRRPIVDKYLRAIEEIRLGTWTIKYDEFGNKSKAHREQETEQFSEKKVKRVNNNSSSYLVKWY